MIFRIVCIILVMLLSAEALPVLKKDLRPASLNQADQNRHGPLFRFPAGPSPQSFSISSPIRKPATEFSDMLHRKKKKSDESLTSRSMHPFNVFFDRYHRNTHSRTTQRVKQLGQQVRDTVQHFGNRYGERIQHVMEMIEHKFRFDDVKDRLKETFLKKKTFMNKLHGFGERGKFVGIPFHTMNDDHMIVKKPGVDFESPSLPNTGDSILAPVPALQTIATQRPVLPDSTTSVELHQEWEAPATMDGYVFPITSTASYAPEVMDTTEITIPIDQEKSTTRQLTQGTSNSTVTTTSTHPGPESTTLKASVTETPYYDTYESTEAEVEMIFTSTDELCTIENDDFGTVTSVPGVITEIGSTSFSTPSSIETTLQMETTSLDPQVSPITVAVDLFSGIQVKPLTSSVIDVESTTNEIRSTFSPAIMTAGDEFASSVIDADTTIGAIIPTFSPATTTQTILGTEETLPQTLDLGISTVQGGSSSITNTAFTSSAMDRESISEAISRVSFIISTERPVDTNPTSIIIDTAYGSLETDSEMTMEIVSTPYSTIPTQTTSTPSSPAFQINQISNGLSTIEYNLMDTTFEIDSTFSSTISSEASTVRVTQESFIVDPVLDNSILETEKPIEIISTLSSSPAIEMIMIPYLDYSSPISRGENTMDMVSALQSTFSTETTTWSPLALEKAPLTDVFSENGYNRFPSLIDEGEIILEVESTVPSTLPAQTTAILTEGSVSVDKAFDYSTIKSEMSTEIIPNFSSTFTTETATTLEEISTTRNSDFRSTASDRETTSDNVATLSGTILSDTTTISPPTLATTPFVDASSRFGYYHFPSFTHEMETSTRVDSTLSSMLSNEVNTVVSTTVNPVLDISIIEMERTTEIFPTFPSKISPESITSLEEIFTSTNSHISSSEIAEGINNEVLPKFSSTVPIKATLTPVLEMSTLSDALPGFGYNHLTSSAYGSETTTEVDTLSDSTIPTATTTMVIERVMAADSTSDHSAVETEITVENVSQLSLTTTTEEPTTLNEISTTINPANDKVTSDRDQTTSEIVLTLPSTIPFRSELDLKIPVVDVSLTYGYNQFPSWTDEVEKTTGVDSTFLSTIPAEITTSATERLTTVGSAFDISPIDTERTTEIVPTLFPVISTDTATTLEAISTTTQLVDTPPIDEEIAVEVIPIFSFTFPTEITTTPVSEINTPLAVLPMYEHNRFIDVTISSEQSTILTERPATLALKNSGLDLGVVTDMDMDSMFTSGISTKQITTLGEVSTTTDLPFDILTNPGGTSAQDILTFPATIPIDNEIITGFGNISRFTYPASTGSTNDGETTTEIDSTLSATILTETTVVSNRKYDMVTEQKFEDLDEQLVSDDKRNGRFLHTNSESTWPRFSYNFEEEPGEKTSLDLIPMIVEYYAKIT